MEGMGRGGRRHVIRWGIVCLGALVAFIAMLASALVARGFAGTVHVSPGSVTFGSQEEVTTSHSRDVVLSNNDTVPLVINGIAIVNGDTGDFAVSHDGCGHQLDAGDSCSVSVVFRPGTGEFGPRSSTLEFDFQNGVSPQSVSLIGRVASPDVNVDPSDLTFAPREPGTASAPQTVTVHNGGSGELQITDVKLDPTDDFSLVNGDCLGTVDAGDSCSLDIVYSPKNSQGDVHLVRTAVLSIADNDPASPQQLVALEGTVPSPDLDLSTTSLTFPDQEEGTTGGGQAVSIRNSGTAPLTIDALEIGGLNAADFTVVRNTCPGTLGVGAGCSFTIAFSPEKPGGRSALLIITDDAPTPTRTVALHGNARPAPPKAEPAPGGGADGGGAAAEPAVTPAHAAPAAPAVATPSPTAAATADATAPAAAERPVVTTTPAPHPTSAAPALDTHGTLAGTVLTAFSNDGRVVRAAVTGLLMLLPFALAAAVVWWTRRAWLRRRAG